MDIRLFFCVIYLVILCTNAFGQKQFPAAKSKDRYQQQDAAIDQAQEQFKLLRNSSSWVVNNPGNHLGFTINEKGYEVHLLTTYAHYKPWLAAFTIQQINQEPVSFASGHYVQLMEYPALLLYTSSRMNIEYINTTAGLRQNFIVHKKNPVAHSLNISIKVETFLQAAVKAGRQFILKDRNGKKEPRLFYDSLKVWDTNGKPLESSMTYDSSTSLLTITVNDAHAEYPVTIDPVNRTPA